MIRATTPTQTFFIGTDDVVTLLITYAQDDIVLEKHLEDVELNEGVITFKMTQEETKLFKKGLVHVQLRFKNSGGTVFASQKMTASVGDVLNDEVL